MTAEAQEAFSRAEDSVTLGPSPTSRTGSYRRTSSPSRFSLQAYSHRPTDSNLYETPHSLGSRDLPKLGEPTLPRHSLKLQLCDEEGPALPSLLLTEQINPQRKSNLSPPFLLMHLAARSNNFLKISPRLTPPDVFSWTQGSGEGSVHFTTLQVTLDRPHLGAAHSSFTLFPPPPRGAMAGFELPRQLPINGENDKWDISCYQQN